MQRPWTSTLWLPTIRPDRLSIKNWKRPSQEEINTLAKRLSQLTLEIIELPYDPRLWAQRASVLYLLGYPELSVGDAYKARMLIDAAQSTNVSQLTDHVRIVIGMKLFVTATSQQQSRRLVSDQDMQKLDRELETLALKIWTILLNALVAANAYMDSAATMKRATTLFGDKLPKDMPDMKRVQQKIDLKTKAAQQDLLTGMQRQAAIRNGSILSRPYPWMTTDLLQRPNNVISIMTEQMNYFSEGKCTIGKSQIQEQSPDQPLGDDVLGVYATRDISKGEILFSDSTTTAVAAPEKERCTLCCTTVTNSNKVKCPSCWTFFCSQTCLAAASLTGQRATCYRSMIYAGFGKEDPTKYTRRARAKLIMRYLEFIVQHLQTVNNPQLHPLQVHPILRLTPKYTGSEIVPFNLLDDVVHPLSMLSTLGIDIFADHRFDTWVLMTMRLRLNNNVVGIVLDAEDQKDRDYVYGVYPLMAVLNHSCDPHVRYNREAADATIVLKAVRDIKEGEEIFTSYLPDQKMRLLERRAALMAWLGTECLCSRCVEEERQM